MQQPCAHTVSQPVKPLGALGVEGQCFVCIPNWRLLGCLNGKLSNDPVDHFALLWHYRSAGSWIKRKAIFSFVYCTINGP